MFPLDAFRNTLAKVVDVLQRHSIRFHLTGGITSVVYGEPRMTQDIDIVIDNEAVSARIEPFIDSIAESDFLFDAPRFDGQSNSMACFNCSTMPRRSSSTSIRGS